MRSRVTRAFPARLEAARRRFERWRRTCEGRSRIPDPLWNSAVKLSATHGIHRTAKTLRLNPNSLKKRVASADVNGSRGQENTRRKPAGPAAAVAFVELVPSEGVCSPECIVELENRRGVKMWIQVAGSRSPDVAAAVSKVFLIAVS